ncbi:response regulator [Kingella kingae]|nr:response regulator [Kingella kingae]MDK4525683.1 response regulator [Kingella kingae]MDK4527907.1 response regulator [Kingella kingae]MDK4530650.1 response regulator [Kingella kingae]MDK4531683.1 response regulator [Kingella kingae]MDK4533871.1 response regulator [Kingella kingae]
MPTLMIVDDSNIIRNRIERSIQGLDIQVVATASDGAKAVEMFKEHKPDLVTMDLTMPNLDGLECIKQIRALSQNTSILVVSALSDRQTGLRALQYGARGFICKPFTDEQLVIALNKLISHQQKR